MSVQYEISEADKARLDKDFTHHAPHGNQAERYQIIRNSARLTAEDLIGQCPPSRELSLALTNLEQAVFWANAAIARNEHEKE